jgi:homoaconitase/3-isopropylmalate dehydratase large subunit
MNLIESALAKANSLQMVRPGDYLLIKPAIMIAPSKHALQIIRAFDEAGYKQVIHRDPVVFCVEPGEIHPEILHFCITHGIRLYHKCERTFLLDLHKELQQVAVIAGTSRRSRAAGALGMIPLILSPFELAHYLGKGSMELFVPETIYVNISSPLKAKLDADKVIRHLADYFYADGLLGKSVVIGGDVIETMETEERMRIAECSIGPHL